MGLFTFIAILFTSGLDMGLIILPLTEFPTYEQDEVYAFASPLAVEFGFWGFLIWTFYFVSTVYFVALEPKLEIFEKPAIRWVHNAVIIATCAFTAHLFLANIAWYLPDLNGTWRVALVAAILLTAILSSTDLRFVRWLSVSSTALFFALIAGVWLALGQPPSELLASLAPLGDYFTQVHRFVLPLSDYHAFYLFWWFSWSLMIGQFVARFLGGLRLDQLLLALLVIPSIPIAIWFAVLYRYHSQATEISPAWKLVFVAVGILFVINSVDSLVRLYSENTGLTVARLGKGQYVACHLLLMGALVALYRLTPLKIEWVGLVVIGVFAATLVFVVKRRGEVLALDSD
ncbi:MAG: BCCT family transporter [Acidobacteriota bacterium]